MTVLHLLYSGGTGGIEKLCKDISINSFKTKNAFAFVNSGGCFYDEMNTRGEEVYLLNLKNKDILKLKNEIIFLKKQINADVIVVHHPSPLIWLATILLKIQLKNKIKLLVYAHNNFSQITCGKNWKKLIYKFLLKKCDGIISISQFVKKSILKEVNISEEKIRVIYNGISVNEYKASMAKNQQLNIVFVGRLIREKGVHILIDSIAKLREECNVHLVIVGDGQCRKELENQAKELKLCDIITFTGALKNVQRYFSSADIFVHPAIWEEGFGITIIEAMASGLICVTFNKGAIPEIITDGKDGFIVNETSSEALYEKLKQIHKNFKKDELLKIKESAIKRAGFFNIKKVVDQLDKLYEEIVL